MVLPSNHGSRLELETDWSHLSTGGPQTVRRLGVTARVQAVPPYRGRAGDQVLTCFCVESVVVRASVTSVPRPHALAFYITHARPPGLLPPASGRADAAGCPYTLAFSLYGRFVFTTFSDISDIFSSITTTLPRHRILCNLCLCTPTARGTAARPC